MNPLESEFDDVGEALRENRPLRPTRGYLIRFGLESLNFKTIQLADPVPTGRQILGSAGLSDSPEYAIFAILNSGDFEDIRHDEKFDLRERGAERFIAFQTDRTFTLTLNGSQLLWGKPSIPSDVLYELGSVSSEEALFQKVHAGENRLVEHNECIDLSGSGVEQFFTAPRPQKRYVIIVNSREETVPDKLVTFTQVVQLSHPGSPSEANVIYSMTYRNAASMPHAGELGEGGSVEVKRKGTIFNVTPTTKS